jgi:16S rRNA (adenine1518-N6/adenine1519-N6)-dimethyltransferase
LSQNIVEKYKIRAKKALGQNFLVDDFIVEEIAHAAEVENKNIIEV